MDDRPDQDDVGAEELSDLDADSEDARFARTQRPWTLGERLRMFFARPIGDFRGDTYSSLSPRKPDGTRTRLFFFNGNGQGR